MIDRNRSRPQIFQEIHSHSKSEYPKERHKSYASDQPISQSKFPPKPNYNEKEITRDLLKKEHEKLNKKLQELSAWEQKINQTRQSISSLQPSTIPSSRSPCKSPIPISRSLCRSPVPISSYQDISDTEEFGNILSVGPKIPEVIHRPISSGRINPTTIHHVARPSIQAHTSFNGSLAQSSRDRYESSDDDEELLRSTYEESVEVNYKARSPTRRPHKTKASRPKRSQPTSGAKTNHPRKFPAPKEKPHDKQYSQQTPFVYQMPSNYTPYQMMPPIQFIQPIYPYYPYQYNPPQYIQPQYPQNQPFMQPQSQPFMQPQYPQFMPQSPQSQTNQQPNITYEQFISQLPESARNTPSVYSESIFSSKETKPNEAQSVQLNASSRSKNNQKDTKFTVDTQKQITINISNSKLSYTERGTEKSEDNFSSQIEPEKELVRQRSQPVLKAEPLVMNPSFRVNRSIKEPSPDLISRLASGEKSKVEKAEMRKLTNKNYNLLPEVKQRKEEEERKEFLKQRLAQGKAYEVKLSEMRRKKSSGTRPM